MPESKKEADLKVKLLAATGLGMELLGLVAVFFYAGRYLDGRFEWPGYGVTIGGMIALVVWLTHVVRIIQGLDRDAE